MKLSKIRVRGRALVNMVMNLRVPKKKKGGEFLSLLSNC
jgi:hypothetical protein